MIILGAISPAFPTILCSGQGMASSHPQTSQVFRSDDEWVEIDCSLEVNVLDMPSSTEQPTEGVVQGWVVMSKKPPGETIQVQLEVVAQDSYVWACATPNSLIFHREGTQYFNLSIWLEEDAAPGIEHRIDINAMARSKIGSDGDAAVIIVKGIAEYAAEAEMIEQPGAARPGGSVNGIVQIWNQGTMWSTYLPSLITNPEGVVETVEFDIEVEVSPNLMKKVPFEIEVAKDAKEGMHQVTLGLVAVLQDGSTAIMDTFNVTIEVHPSSNESAIPFAAILLVAMLVAVPAAISVSRKA